MAAVEANVFCNAMLTPPLETNPPNVWVNPRRFNRAELPLPQAYTAAGFTCSFAYHSIVPAVPPACCVSIATFNAYCPADRLVALSRNTPPLMVPAIPEKVFAEFKIKVPGPETINPPAPAMGLANVTV